MSTRRLSVLMVPLVGLLLGSVVIAEEPGGKKKDEYDELEDLRVKLHDELVEKRKEYVADRKRRVDGWMEEFKQQQAEEERLGEITVNVDGKEISKGEPKDPPEAIWKGRGKPMSVWKRSPDDYDILVHDVWKLKKEDLRADRMAQITVELEYLPDPTYNVISFKVTNSTHKARRISPRLWIVTSDMRFTPEVGGLIVQRAVEKSTLKDYEDLAGLAGLAVRDPSGALEQSGYFAPGQTRRGIAIFKRFDQEMDEMKVVVDGLDNDMRYHENLRRALVLDYGHVGDEFYPQRESLEFRGKSFEYIWNWYQGITIGKPSRIQIETPSKKRQKNLWYYKYTLANRTRKPQALELTRFDTVVKVSVNLSVSRKAGGLDPESGKAVERPFSKEFDGEVEAAIVDEGMSTIHKAQVMREIGAEFKVDRFFKGELAPGKSFEGLVIFDEAEVDWEPIYEHIENRMNAKGFVSTLENPEKIEDFYVKIRSPVVRLTDEEKAKIRTQILGAIPDALSERHGKKRIVGDVTGKSGIGSGRFRIRRSFFQRGTIEDYWLNKWEQIY